MVDSATPKAGSRCRMNRHPCYSLAALARAFGMTNAYEYFVILYSFFVTTSKALVTTSVAPVTTSFLFLRVAMEAPEIGPAVSGALWRGEVRRAVAAQAQPKR